MSYRFTTKQVHPHSQPKKNSSRTPPINNTNYIPKVFYFLDLDPKNHQ